jgi:hypothetical protein
MPKHSVLPGPGRITLFKVPGLAEVHDNDRPISGLALGHDGSLTLAINGHGYRFVPESPADLAFLAGMLMAAAEELGARGQGAPDPASTEFARTAFASGASH